MKTILIVGSMGQDGRILTDLMVNDGHRVIGLHRNGVDDSHDLFSTSTPLDISDQNQLKEFIQNGNFDEIYYLAAHHVSSQGHVGSEITLLKDSHFTHVTIPQAIIEACLELNKCVPFFYASSCLIHGEPKSEKQDENHPQKPIEIYGMTKRLGGELCQYYGRKYRFPVSVGILFNHESHLRKDTFLSKKVISTALRIKNGSSEKLEIGNLSPRVDWSHAKDICRAMITLVKNRCSGEFVIASGTNHSVQDFAEEVFHQLGMKWEEHVIESNSLLTRTAFSRRGDTTKIKKLTGWHPEISFSSMIKDIITSIEAGIV